MKAPPVKKMLPAYTMLRPYNSGCSGAVRCVLFSVLCSELHVDCDLVLIIKVNSPSLSLCLFLMHLLGNVLQVCEEVAKHDMCIEGTFQIVPFQSIWV